MKDLQTELLVVKVGTSTLIDEHGKFRHTNFLNLSEEIKNQKTAEKDVVLITSGAISAGEDVTGRTRAEFRKDLDGLSALAAYGQVPLMEQWRGYLEPLMVAQNLVTSTELYTPEGPAYLRKLRATILLGGVAIINENDAVADEEIKFGDNDQLAASIAVGLQRLGGFSVKLLILSDIAGFYDQHPGDENARLVHAVHDFDAAEASIADTDTKRGTGGMRTKILAARIAKQAGVDTYLGDGSEPQIISLLIRRNAGTVFYA